MGELFPAVRTGTSKLRMKKNAETGARGYAGRLLKSSVHQWGNVGRCGAGIIGKSRVSEKSEYCRRKGRHGKSLDKDKLEGR